MQEWIQKHLDKILGASAGVSFLQFITNLYNYASDGVLTGQEVQKLLVSASGVETMLLLVVIIYLQFKK